MCPVVHGHVEPAELDLRDFLEFFDQVPVLVFLCAARTSHRDVTQCEQRHVLAQVHCTHSPHKEHRDARHVVWGGVIGQLEQAVHFGSKGDKLAPAVSRSIASNFDVEVLDGSV